MKVKDCMCEEVYSVTPEAKVKEVAKIMAQKHVGAVIIKDKENCIKGIITDRDIILRTFSEEKDLRDVPVTEIMSTDVKTCNQEDNIEEATTKMSNKHVRRLPVVNNENKIVGMLTLGDLTQKSEKIGKEKVCDTAQKICECNTDENNA